MQGDGDIGPPRAAHWRTPGTGRVTESCAGRVGDEKGEECRIAVLDGGKIGTACRDVLRLYPREFRQRDQGLTNPLDEVPLLRRGQFGQGKRLILRFNLTRTEQGNFIAGLDRDHGQESNGDQQKEAGEKTHFVDSSIHNCAAICVTQGRPGRRRTLSGRSGGVHASAREQVVTPAAFWNQ